ncbi:MAG: cyclic pyranopterin monophosphate synthase MoaC [Saprospiraceae bacterium]|nr:cyclic pyranopterin monophosphate synthase MoaC [Saprospiraceae bacterium]
MSDFSHLDKSGKAVMVDVSEKTITRREATARAMVILPPEVVSAFDGDDISTKKGSVFQTARLAGMMAVKKTSDLIPLCHPLPINGCGIDITRADHDTLWIDCTVRVDGKTGVEMEALTGASVAALTIYDMCKALSHEIVISQIQLMHKTGGKRDFDRT